MKKKSKLLIVLVIILSFSLILNVYFGVSSFIESTYTPDSEDRDILAEMTKMVIDNEEYQEIATRETVYAIEQGVSRFNVSNPSSIHHYEIQVQTEKETYIFTCIDEKCTDVSNEGWTYSRYSEEEPILPLNKKN
ncbi:hypothetical protein QGM71_14820 [Virgibacillus sp. C22-A2]|uniref:DUF3139 domain-containing protein n=1 Tax=Virgibacillus tibetensis TaxID=3042313 RepID=A0ABU6KK12_9BACI|nr:hypothetical protein [Virgibacillus sp. C22-A2]